MIRAGVGAVLTGSGVEHSAVVWVGPERETDEVLGTQVASWFVRGRNPPVVCVHGAGVSSRQTLPLLEALDGRVETWAVDLPGYGESEEPGRFLHVPELADALVQWFRTRGLDRPCLLGVSLGTQVVAEAAAREPDAVGSVVLAGPTTDPAARSLPTLAARLVHNNFYEGLGVIPQSFRDYRAAGARRVLLSWVESRNHRIEGVLPEVGQPALVVWGTNDKMSRRFWTEEVTRMLPRGRLAAIPGKPHALTAAAPEELAGLVEEFVAEEKR